MERKLESNAFEATMPLRKFGRCPPVRYERKKGIGAVMIGFR
jgi:hypothetical protein